MSHEEIRHAREKASAELLNDFFGIAQDWELSIDEQRMLIGDKSINGLLMSIDKTSNPLLDDMAIARLVMITGIRNDLRILFTEPGCNTYLRSANKYFDGESPLSVMLNESVSGIASVQAYLKGTILGS